MRSCMISLVLMSICSAQGQSSFAGSWVSSGTGGRGGQSQSSYGHYQGSQDSGVVSVQAISGDPYFSSSTSAMTSSSGYNENGAKYDRHTVENIIENTLYHSESIQWPSLNIVNEFRFRLDLSDPHATPVWDYATASNNIRVYRPSDAGIQVQREDTDTIQRKDTGLMCPFYYYISSISNRFFDYYNQRCAAS